MVKFSVYTYMPKITQKVKRNIINLYKHGESCRGISKKLKIYPAKISSLLKENNIKVKLYCRFATPENIHDKIIKSYITKELNTYELGEKYHVSYTSIRNLLIKNNIPIRPKTERMRRFTLNEDFFSYIDTEEKGYILGFLYADGYNNGKNAITLHLHSRDRDILEKIKEVIGYSGNLYKTKKQDSLILVLNSEKLSKRLTELGCVKAKSLILKFPQNIIPENLMSHFIRGYMDGDGCITIDKRTSSGNISFVGSYNFIDELQKFFIKNFGLKGYKRTKNKVKELIYGGQNQSLTILNWLYNDATIFLKRKYDKYLLIKNRPNKRNK